MYSITSLFLKHPIARPHRVLVESQGTLEILQTKLAYVQFRKVGVVSRIRGRVPGVNFVAAKLDDLELVAWHGRLGTVCRLYLTLT